MSRVMLIVLCLAACDGGTGPKAESKPQPTGGGQAATQSGGQGQPSGQGVGAGTSGKAFPADAPAVQACKVDADCTVAVDAAVGSDPCCNITTTAMPIAVAYVQFMDSWQKANCAGVSCPPMSLPGAQTAPCGMRGHCDKGTCTNSCSLPPDGGPPAR
jgi:hypothetical protein